MTFLTLFLGLALWFAVGFIVTLLHALRWSTRDLTLVEKILAAPVIAASWLLKILT